MSATKLFLKKVSPRTRCGATSALRKRNFARATEKKGLSEGTSQAQEMRPILDWFNKLWSRTPPVAKAPSAVEENYKRALSWYKHIEIQRMNLAEIQKGVLKKRQLAAILALPPRLRMTALCDCDDRWVEKQSPEPLDILPDYDVDNFRTWHPYVKALFEYNWKPGTEIPLQRVAKQSFDDDKSMQGQMLDDDDLNFKLEGIHIQTTEENLKERYTHEELRKLFDRKKIIPQPKAKGLKKSAPVKKKVGGEAKVVSKYPPVDEVLNNPDEQKKVLRDLDDYLSTLKPAERTEFISGLLRMEGSKETSKLEKPRN